MNQIELEKIADFFDKDRSGMIDLNEILRVIKGSKRGKYVQEAAMTDSQKIENEVRQQSCFHDDAHTSQLQQLRLFFL